MLTTFFRFGVSSFEVLKRAQAAQEVVKLTIYNYLDIEIIAIKARPEEKVLVYGPVILWHKHQQRECDHILQSQLIRKEEIKLLPRRLAQPAPSCH